MTVLRKISGSSISLSDRYRNEEIRAALEINLDIVEIIRRIILSCVSRMKPERIPMSIIHGHLHGNRPRKIW